jgi:hypothetical protein
VFPEANIFKTTYSADCCFSNYVGATYLIFFKVINKCNNTWYNKLKSNENEVKYIDLRRKIEIKKITNLMRNETILFYVRVKYCPFYVIKIQ